jgi:hypothetical protein
MQNQRSAFAAKREKGQAPLFSFGIGKVGTGGRVPLPESHNMEEREGTEEREERGFVVNCCHAQVQMIMMLF